MLLQDDKPSRDIKLKDSYIQQQLFTWIYLSNYYIIILYYYNNYSEGFLDVHYKFTIPNLV